MTAATKEGLSTTFGAPIAITLGSMKLPRKRCAIMTGPAWRILPPLLLITERYAGVRHSVDNPVREILSLNQCSRPFSVHCVTVVLNVFLAEFLDESRFGVPVMRSNVVVKLLTQFSEMKTVRKLEEVHVRRAQLLT